MFAFAAQAFVTMFVIIDPPGLAPIFVSVAGDRPPEAQRHLARKAIGISAVVLAVFAAGGSALFEFLGVSLEAFSIAGGILLFKIAVDMVLAQRHRQTAEEEEESHHRDDVSVFPLAIPLITGPGAFATILVLVGQAGPDPERLGLLAAASAAVLLMAYASLRLAGLVSKFLGQTGINVVTRILGLILAALAVQYVANGVLALI
jgi:multiple antibiotic resistance protein